MMTLGEFDNGLRLLNSIDEHELGNPAWWQQFRDDPYRFLVCCADEDADLIWAAMVKRGAVKADPIFQDMLAALQATEREYENLEDRAPVDSGCIECTVGTVPNKFNTGLCAHHLRRKAIAKATGGAS